MSILSVRDGPPEWGKAVHDLGTALVKQADAEVSYSLVGQLYLSRSGWILLSVPNNLVRGIFQGINEPGIELPRHDTDSAGFNAHISVIRPEEIEQIGGADKVSERGKQFHYRIGGLYSMEPEGWPEVSRVWYCRVYSPELQSLRRSYGLSGLPNEGKYDFHITCAIRRRGVLGRNETSKTGNSLPRDDKVS